MQNMDPEMLKKIQERSAALQQKVAEMRIEGTAGSGDLWVKVIINGKHEALAVEVAPELMKQPIEVLQGLVASAFTGATHKLEIEMQKEFLTAFGQQ